MQKDFQKWHNKKAKIDEIIKRPFFHEREIWFCHLGANIGFEQDGSGEEFLRPIVIARKFNNEVFWAVPLTKTDKKTQFYLLMNNQIIEEVLCNQEEIFSNIEKESISVYIFLKNEYKKGNIQNNYVFQFVFRSYYRLDNAGLGDRLKKKYFELLANQQNDLSKILSELYDISTLRGLHTIQFSFATKLLHTINDNYPIFDSQVSKVFHKRVLGENKDERIEFCKKINEFLKNTYKDFLQDERIKKIILSFRAKFNVNKN